MIRPHACNSGVFSHQLDMFTKGATRFFDADTFPTTGYFFNSLHCKPLYHEVPLTKIRAQHTLAHRRPSHTPPPPTPKTHQLDPPLLA